MRRFWGPFGRRRAADAEPSGAAVPPASAAYERALALDGRREYVAAFRAYRDAAEGGDTRAMLVLADRDTDGEPWLRSAIEHGCREATDAYVVWLLQHRRRADACDVVTRAAQQGRTDLWKRFPSLRPEPAETVDASPERLEREALQQAHDRYARAVRAGRTELAGYLYYFEQRLAGVTRPEYPAKLLELFAPPPTAAVGRAHRDTPTTRPSARPSVPRSPEPNPPASRDRSGSVGPARVRPADDRLSPDAEPASPEAMGRVIRAWAQVTARIPATVPPARHDAWLARTSGVSTRQVRAARAVRNRIAHDPVTVSRAAADRAVRVLGELSAALARPR